MGREREPLGWLAQISSRHADELRRLQFCEADSRRQLQIRDFCTAISAEGDLSRQRFTAKRPEDHYRGERGTVARVRGLSEADWDPAEHPRVPKGETGGGQWANKDGSSSDARGRAKGLTVRTAIYSGPKKVSLRYVGWKSVGHHWVPVGVTRLDDIRPLLTDEAVQYATGAYSGRTVPSHNAGRLNGVKHSKYSAKVKFELLRYMKLKGITAQ